MRTQGHPNWFHYRTKQAANATSINETDVVVVVADDDGLSDISEPLVESDLSRHITSSELPLHEHDLTPNLQCRS
jgi:hypothetical protein